MITLLKNILLLILIFVSNLLYPMFDQAINTWVPYTGNNSNSSDKIIQAPKNISVTTQEFTNIASLKIAAQKVTISKIDWVIDNYNVSQVNGNSKTTRRYCGLQTIHAGNEVIIKCVNPFTVPVFINATTINIDENVVPKNLLEWYNPSSTNPSDNSVATPSLSFSYFPSILKIGVVCVLLYGTYRFIDYRYLNSLKK